MFAALVGMFPRAGLAPAPPAMFTMRPQLFFFMWGITNWDMRRYPYVLSVSASVINSASSSRISPPRAAPALLMRMSTPPKFATHASTTFLQPSSEFKSEETDMPSPPAAFTSSTAVAKSASSRAVTHTRAPSFASAIAHSRPMPRLAPVTMATFPVKPKSISSLLRKS